MIKSACFILLLLLPASFESKPVILVEELPVAITDSANYAQFNDSDIDHPSDIRIFIGRFHPVLVHLPIGFLLFAFSLECMSLFKRYEYLKLAVPLALFMGIVSGIAAGLTGYLLSSGGGYNEGNLSYHKWFGISVVILSSLAYIIRITSYDLRPARNIYRLLLLAMTGTVIVTGHYGGSLTHGSDYLFRYMPDPLRALTGKTYIEEEDHPIGLIEDLDKARVYDDVIHPIMIARCESCHNNDRKEGGLLMTTYDHIMMGGESGSVIVTNNAHDSELYKRLILPHRAEDRMPPRGRRQLTHDQIRLIEWWINQGAPSAKLISELEISDDISSIFDKLTVDGQSFIEKTQVPEADKEIIQKLHKHGFKISPLSEGINFLQASTSRSKTNITIEDVQLLSLLSKQITWLDLGRLDITDDDLIDLSKLKNLTRLNLPQTNIGNATLEKVGKLNNLEYLNIYATKIDDEGIRHLEPLNNLKSLYIWQTDVTMEAIDNLQSQLPDLYINYGYN